MNSQADRARTFALYSFGIAMLVIAVAALLFAVSWRQHYGPCGDVGAKGSVQRTCALAPYSQ